MTGSWQSLQRWRWTAAGLLAIVGFAVLAGRFWHPHYGFTKFVQMGAVEARTAIREIHEHPVFVYEGSNSYDGAAYTQIAFHPLLGAPELQDAVGNVPYRARRILGSALAWLLAGGDPARIASTYAALNLGVWLVFSALLWRVLNVNDARTWLAWAGVMFSAGALHSVRLALTDLLAATLVTAAIWLGGRGRISTALVTLATAGLARETALAGVAGLWRGPWRSPRAWIGNATRSLAVVTPLILWVAYIRWKAGPADQGFGNFTWPLIGWLEKWADTVADYARLPTYRWLNTTTLLSTIAVTVQAVFFLRRRRVEDSWWRVGIAGVAMMAAVGTSVWEGHPGAATRVLLPMGVAFAVFAVREQASVAWVIAGSLSVFSGVQALWHVPHDPRELDAGRSSIGSYVVRLHDGWYNTERRGHRAWAWTARGGRLEIESSARSSNRIHVRMHLRAMGARDIDITDGKTTVWKGRVETQRTWIEFPATLNNAGKLVFELHSNDPPVRENERAGARTLGFAVHGVEVR